MKRLAAIAVLMIVLGGCTSEPPESHVTNPTEIDTPYDTSQIRQTGSQKVTFGGIPYTATSYVNDAYLCGTGKDPYPFIVVEQTALAGEQRPLWAMLHGGGTGWYDKSGVYQGQESYNNAESAPALLAVLAGYLGFTGTADTFIGDRIRAGDRVALGSLCDHDLMMGLGQPYPNNPAGGTVDGLLANLAMMDWVSSDRPTSTRWIVGQSAGSYGAWALAHNLWSRGLPVSGVIMDSGLLSARSFDLFDAGVGAEYYKFDAAEMAAKHGPYFTDPSLYAENAIGAGFDIPLFNADAQGDPGCGGASAPIAAATTAGYAFNCDWLNAALADAIAADGNPNTQQSHVYPGGGHIVTSTPGKVQADLRAWFASLG